MWHKYVLAPALGIVSPRALIHTYGNVSNAEGLVSNVGEATFERPHTEDAVPSITLDSGQNVIGFAALYFAGASTNSPGIRLTFQRPRSI